VIEREIDLDALPRLVQLHLRSPNSAHSPAADHRTAKRGCAIGQLDIMRPEEQLPRA
jgi:hypothetical protein